MTILIGLGGYAKSGKDAFADFLVENHGGVKEFMSRPLLEALLRINPDINVKWSNWERDTWPQEFRYKGIDYMPYQDLYDLVGYERSKSNYSVRVLLQRLGTEVGRNMLGEDVWVNYAMRSMDEHLAAGTPTALTGIRYHNELEAIHERGGLGIWVSRPGYGPVNSHSSDNTLGRHDFDVVVRNEGTLYDLCFIVDGIIKRWGPDGYQHLSIEGRISAEGAA